MITAIQHNKNIKAKRSLQSRAYYETKLAVKRYREEICSNNAKIWELADDAEAYGYTNNHFYKMELALDEANIWLLEQLQKLEPTRSNELRPSERSQVSTVKLPKIELPKFDGNYLQWTEFQELFSEHVHCQPIGGAQKMLYLKRNLGTEPGKLIQHLPVTDDNYITAWDLLEARYKNHRLRVSNFLDKLLLTANQHIPTSEGIKKLHDTTKKGLQDLKNVGVEIQGPILHHLLVRKVDPITRRYYEQSLDNPKALQDVGEFLQFLDQQFHALEAQGS